MPLVGARLVRGSSCRAGGDGRGLAANGDDSTGRKGENPRADTGLDGWSLRTAIASGLLSVADWLRPERAP